jgi:hypothetical protein
VLATAFLQQSAFAQDFPERPSASTNAAQDRARMMAQLNATPPVLPSKLLDPNRPPSAYPQNLAQPEGNWRNFYGHQVTRSQWGLWNNYEDTSNGMLHADGFNGWDKFTINDPDSWRVFDDAKGDYAQGAYTPIDLLKMNDGRRVWSADMWWNERRPEIFKDVQEQLYGRIPDRSLWPAITWQLGAATEGTANGVAYRQRVITGVIDISSYPELRNRPSINATLRVPKAQFDAGESVPVIIGFGGVTWASVAPRGWGTISFSQGSVQGGGGANMSSWIIGLFNKGGWRKPDDMGTLAAWAWGVGRLIDRLEAPVPADASLVTPANEFLGVNVKKLGITGHSFLGKATIVTMAYEPRILIAYPSRGGSGGPKMNRRHWGQDLENSLGSDSEYYWYAGNAYKYVGALNAPGVGSGEVVATDLPAGGGTYPGNNSADWRTLYPLAGADTKRGTYLPRKLELMTVDAHSLVALAAPRPVFTNGGTHDSWTDQRGMWLTQVFATPVYNLLGRKGLIDQPWPFDPNYVPQSPVTIYTPVIRNFGGYIEGHLGYRYAGEPLHPEVPGEASSGGGHTAADDMPAFVNFAAKFFDDVTPPALTPVANQTLEATSTWGETVRYSASAPDTVDDNVPVEFSVPSGSTFYLGATQVTASATDVSGNAATQTFTVNVVDTKAPAITRLTVSSPTLSPANNQMRKVGVEAKLYDIADAKPVARIVGVTSNQPAGSDADWVVLDALNLQLRAQKDGAAPRTYTITVEARDASNNVATSSVKVTVP